MVEASTESKKRTRKRWFYPVCFVLGFIIVIPLLTVGTVFATFSDIWKDQGRIESTKLEFFVGHFVGGKRSKLIQAGVDPNAWYMEILTDIDQWAYHSAIEKIPEGNFERLFWHYRSNVWPKVALPEDRYESALQFLVSDAVDKLSKFDGYEMISYADRDVERYQIANIYAGYIIGYGKEYLSNDFGNALSLALNKTCYSALNIEPDRVKTYKLDSYLNDILWIISNAYLRTSLHSFDDFQHCNKEVAKCWLAIKERLSPVLIEDKELASYYLSADEKTSQRYKEFIEYYQVHAPEHEQKIRENCIISDQYTKGTA